MKKEKKRKVEIWVGNKTLPRYTIEPKQIRNAIDGSFILIEAVDGVEYETAPENVVILTSYENKKYCNFCFNSRVYEPTEEELENPFATEFTDENDFSSISVGYSCNGHNLYLSSGAGKPMRFEVLAYNEKIRENQVVGLYSPKFCPECGRALTEYEQEEKS